MADPILDRLLVINDLVKGISQGKYYIEDFYKDNGNPKVIGQGKFTQEKYDKFFLERQDLLTEYQKGMDYIKSVGVKGGYTETHTTESIRIAESIANELKNQTKIDIRFTKLPPKV